MLQYRASGALVGVVRRALVALAVVTLPLTVLASPAQSTTVPPAAPSPLTAPVTAPGPLPGTGALLDPSRGVLSPSPTNPLAQHPWGVYLGPSDMAYEPWAESSGTQRALLDRIVLQPKAQWFGKWVPDNQIADRVHKLIDNATGGDPNVLTQMAIFRMTPWEGNDRVCNRLPTTAEVASYKSWVTRAAAAIGDSYVALILQPDGPFALCALHGSLLPSHLVRYAAKKFAANPNTYVYIDAGADDWDKSNPATALKILIPAGISLVRGFAFNSTHYDETADQVDFGAEVVQALAAKGIYDKHFVVNTSSNGQGFNGYDYKGPDFDNAYVCKDTTQHSCVTLGIPPTADVGNAAWGMTFQQRIEAVASCDGFLWFGRPWLFDQASPFVLKRALALARTTPWQ
ncbi:MAG: glycoside hydrolase family 6 protein [Nocardioides sp.]